MRLGFKAAIAGLLLVGLTGCAAEIGTALGMQLQKSWARGEPIDKYRDYFGRQREVVTVYEGQPAYAWDLSYSEDLTVETDSYAYYNTDRPGMTTGIIYDTRRFDRDCKLTIAYDESTRLVTDLELTNAVKCGQVRAALKQIE